MSRPRMRPPRRIAPDPQDHPLAPQSWNAQSLHSCASQLPDVDPTAFCEEISAQPLQIAQCEAMASYRSGGDPAYQDPALEKEMLMQAHMQRQIQMQIEMQRQIQIQIHAQAQAQMQTKAYDQIYPQGQGYPQDQIYQQSQIHPQAAFPEAHPPEFHDSRISKSGQKKTVTFSADVKEPSYVRPKRAHVQDAYIVQDTNSLQERRSRRRNPTLQEKSLNCFIQVVGLLLCVPCTDRQPTGRKR
eukprot:TRINITY_DN10597_c0_g1_i1.p1 TRINITY_DN10597_c0_g1~~TRINITY_DN10597_c0_g1_i1.p1  ORF type:complete len:243 (+),score=45.65 TRINITY_DN10597_c0_g1_i1:70-798(+)